MALQIGDHVRMRHPEDARNTANTTFEVLEMPSRTNLGPTWWEFLGDTDGLTYVFTMPIVFTIEPP